MKCKGWECSVLPSLESVLSGTNPTFQFENSNSVLSEKNQYLPLYSLSLCVVLRSSNVLMRTE